MHEEHNATEMQKWFNYIESINITIPEYEITYNDKQTSYDIIKGGQVRKGTSVTVLYVHDFVANLYLNGNLNPNNTVHHVDKNIKNNDIHNLIVFLDNSHHERYHNSNYAYLIYDEMTHLFTCELVK